MKALKHPATIIASLALFVALGGEAAMASGLISGEKIVNHSIPAKKLTAAAIKALRGHTGARGPVGPQGIQGVQGIQGNQGPAGPGSNAVVDSVPGTTFLSAPSTQLAQLNLSAGTYIVIGKTSIANTNTGTGENTGCSLDDTQRNEIDHSQTSTSNAANQSTITVMAPLTTTGSSVSLDCGSTDDSYTTATQTKLIAIRVVSWTTIIG